MELSEILKGIQEADALAGQRCRQRWDSIAKPLNGLGVLEDDIVRIAALTRSDAVDISRRAVVVMCADNGVVAQGVTQTGSEVTALVAENIAAGRASVCHMAKIAAAEVIAVDIGMNTHPKAKGLISAPVADGTVDITRAPAMTRAQAERAVMTGVELIGSLKARKIKLIATGEMGIGNTTTASAVASVLLGRGVSEMTGRGAGLDDLGLKRKIMAIEKAIALHKIDKNDVMAALCALGGFDIAGMTGLFLGGAYYRVPVLIDGFISAVAALLAVRLCPAAHCALLASHVSSEPAGKTVLDSLGLSPVITAEMHLGEGTGAVAAIPLLDMALAVYNGMSTFSDIGMEAYKKL